MLTSTKWDVHLPHNSCWRVESIRTRAIEGSWCICAHCFFPTYISCLTALIYICREESTYRRVFVLMGHIIHVQYIQIAKALCMSHRYRTRAHTCAWVSDTGYHIWLVLLITMEAGAEIRSSCICAVGIRSTDGSIFDTLINICKNA